MERVLKKIERDEVILFIVVALIMLVQLVVLGERHDFPDSTTYINMSPEVSCGYPMILWLFRMIFGESGLFWVTVFQNILAAYAVWKITLLLKRIFNLKRCITFLLAFIFIVPFLATAVFTNTGMVVTNSILTEGITVPSYLLVACFVIRAVLHKNMKELLIAAALCFVLVLIRPQMLIPSLVVLGVAIYLCVQRKKIVQVGIVAITVLVMFAANSLANSLYRNFGAVENKSNSLNSLTILTNIFYASDRESAELFEGDEQELFLKIYDKLAEKEATYEFAPKGMLNRARHIEECHDAVKLPIIYVTIYGHIVEKGITEEAKITEKLLDYVKTFRNKLFIENFGTWVYDYFSLSVMGLVRTNSIDSSVLILFSIVMYLMAIALTIFTCVKYKRSNLSKLSILIWIMIIINAFGVSTTIMCLSRYMIYNMSLFYIMVLLQLLGFFRAKDMSFLNIEIKEV